MDFFLKNLEETLGAINKLIDNNIPVVNTKSVRRCNKVKSTDRSKINFIWRTLEYLESKGTLAYNGKVKPKSYKIVATKKIDIPEFIEQIKINRK